MKALKSKLYIIVMALNLLASLGGLVLTHQALSEPLVVPKVEGVSTEDYLHQQNIFNEKPILYSFEQMTVNLSDQEEDKRVQLELNLELQDERGYEEIVRKSAMVRDTVVKILAQKNYDDLASIQGKLLLKDNIAMAVNSELKYGLIKGVYFSRFLIQ